MSTYSSDEQSIQSLDEWNDAMRQQIQQVGELELSDHLIAFDEISQKLSAKLQQLDLG